MSKLTKLLPWVLATVMSQALALDRDQLLREELLGRADANVLPRAPVQRVRPRITLPESGAILVADDSIKPIPNSALTQSEARIIALDTSGAILDEDFITDPALKQPQNAILSPDEDAIWVSNLLGGELDEVRIYDLSGNPQGTLISGDNQIEAIGGIAISHTDSLLVTTAAPTDAVLEFDSNGASVGTFISNLGAVVGPVDILLRRDPVTQQPVEYLVSGLLSDNVGRFDLDGNYKSGEDISVPLPRQVSQALNGNILVASLGTSGDPLDNDGAIFEFAPDGTQVGVYSPFELDNRNRLFRGTLEIPSGSFTGSLLGATREVVFTDDLYLQGGIRVIGRDNSLVTTVLPDKSSISVGVVYAELIAPQQVIFEKTVASTTINAGDPLIYTLTVENVGSSALSNLVVEDFLPANVTYTGNDCAQPDPVEIAGELIFTWTVGSLGSGQTRVCNIETQVIRPLPNGTELVNLATAEADQLVNKAASTVTVTIIGDNLIFQDQFED